MKETMDTSGVLKWMFFPILALTAGANDCTSSTSLSPSVTIEAETELTTSFVDATIVAKKRRKVRVKSRRVERNDEELSQIINEIAQGSKPEGIHTEDVDLQSLLHESSGRTINPMAKWL